MKPNEWQIQPVCLNCVYRRAIYSGHEKRQASYWEYSACHYMLDTGERRDGRPNGDYCPNFKAKRRNKK